MPKRLDDFRWTSEGDFALDTISGDFLSTKNEAYQGLIQKVLTRIGANRGDWAQQATVGANLEDFRGEPSNPEVAQQIIERIRTELVGTGVLTEQELELDAVPAGDNRVIIVLFITPAGSSRSIALSFNYDLRNNKVAER